MKLLIIEDEKDLRQSMISYLSEEGYSWETAEDYEEALKKINHHNYDCFIIDIMLPKGTGLNLIKEIKTRNIQSGIIIVSAQNALDYKIRGLEYGADDYIVKPFHLSELNARIKSVLRRKSFQENNEIVFNEIKLIPDSRQLFVGQKEINLTAKEYDLLMFFISNKGRVITKDSLAEHLSGDYIDQVSSFDFIYTHISNLRKKLIDAGSKDYVSTVYGIGYKFLEE